MYIEIKASYALGGGSELAYLAIDIPVLRTENFNVL
jgi:hypothetical protein